MSYRNPRAANTGNQEAASLQGMQNKIAGAYSGFANATATLATKEAARIKAELKENQRKNEIAENKNIASQNIAYKSFINGNRNNSAIDTSGFTVLIDELAYLNKLPVLDSKQRFLKNQIEVGGTTSRDFVVAIGARKQEFLEATSGSAGDGGQVSKYADPKIMAWSNILYGVEGYSGSKKFVYSGTENGDINIDLEIYSADDPPVLLKTISNNSEFGIPLPNIVPNENAAAKKSAQEFANKNFSKDGTKNKYYDNQEYDTSDPDKNGIVTYSKIPSRKLFVEDNYLNSYATVTSWPASDAISWFNNNPSVNGGALLEQTQGWKQTGSFDFNKDGEINDKDQVENKTEAIKKMIAEAYGEYEANQINFNDSKYKRITKIKPEDEDSDPSEALRENAIKEVDDILRTPSSYLAKSGSGGKFEIVDGVVYQKNENGTRQSIGTTDDKNVMIRFIRNTFGKGHGDINLQRAMMDYIESENYSIQGEVEQDNFRDNIVKKIPGKNEKGTGAYDNLNKKKESKKIN